MVSLVVGIAGGTASGKSTIARGVAASLGDECLLIAHDRYYHSMPEELRGFPKRFNFDHPDALDTDRLVSDLSALLVGQPVRLPDYDYATHLSIEGDEEVGRRRVILVEGILVLHYPGLRRILDHAVFVEAPDDIRLARRIRRDVQHRQRRVEEILDQYEHSVRPMHEAFVRGTRVLADLVLDGTADIDSNVERVLDLPGVRS